MVTVQDDSDIIMQDVDIVHNHDADNTSSSRNEEGGNLIHDCKSLLNHEEEVGGRSKIEEATLTDYAASNRIVVVDADLVAVVVDDDQHVLSSSSDYHNHTKTHDVALERKLQAAPSWVERGDTKLVGTSDFDKFGTPSSLSANGMVLAIGAPYSNGGPGQDSGSVQVFDYADGISYKPRGPAIHGAAAGDTFGWSVSLSNDGAILAVGAPKSNAIGYVKIYKYDGSQYSKVLDLPSSILSGELFGYSISLSGDGKTLAVGTPRAVSTGGYVHLYSIDIAVGTASYLDDFYGSKIQNTELGYSVSISDDGNVLALGDSLLSEVQVHHFDGSSYKPVCTMLGEAVSLSGDGSRFAVRNQTSALVSVYSINAAKQCVQLGQNISISTQSFSGGNYDPTEILMSLSNDGHVLAVANPLNTNGVQVYEEKYVGGQLEYSTRGNAISANSTAVSLSDDGKVLAIGVQRRDLGNGQIEDNGSTLVYEWTLQTTSSGPTPSPTSVSLHLRTE